MNLPIFIIFRVPPGQACSLSQSISPPLHVVYLKTLLMTDKRFFQTPLLTFNVRRTNLVENGQHNLLQVLFAFHYLRQLSETPFRISVVFWEHYNGNPGLLNCLLKLGPDIFPSLKLSVIVKSVNPAPVQRSKEVIGKLVAGIFATETNKDIITPCLVGWGWGWRRRRRAGFLRHDVWNQSKLTKISAPCLVYIILHLYTL